MAQLTGTTLTYGILGDPVAHSLSPLMQNAAMAAAGLDTIYVPFHVTAAALPQAVAGLRALGIRGVNVTIPHKERILPLLDEVNADAALIGAVNTVVLRDGRLFGYNTDAPGFLRAVCEETGFMPEGKAAVVLGAGGACRAALVALAQAGVRRLTVANRSLPRAERLLESFANHFPAVQFQAVALDVGLESEVRQADLVVNSTAVGLHGEEFSLPFEAWLCPSAVLYDMVYRRDNETPLVVAARRRGLSAAGGLSMLLAQGEEAFRLWFAVTPPAGVMKGALSGVK